MRRHILWIGVLLLAVSVQAQEGIVLTTPITAKPAVIDYAPAGLNIDLTVPSVIVTLQATDGTFARFEYPCAPGCPMDTPAKVTAMIVNLNTANLSTRSLWRRLCDRLLLDFPGRFVGPVSVR